MRQKPTPEPTPEKITNATSETPGERMLRVLGRIHGRWRAGTEGAIPPHRVNVQVVARIIGVLDTIEFIQGGAHDHEEGGRTFIHFPAEVIVFDPRCEFPWRLFGVFDWAERQEARDFWRYFH